MGSKIYIKEEEFKQSRVTYHGKQHKIIIDSSANAQKVSR